MRSLPRPLRQIRSLPRAVLALAVGIALALRLGSPAPALSLAAFVAILPILTGADRRSILPLALSIALGGVLGHRAATLAAEDCRAQLPDNRELIAEGGLRVIPAPDPGAMGELYLEGVKVGRSRVAVCVGEVRFRVRRGLNRSWTNLGGTQGELTIGARLRIHGSWQAYPPSGNWPRPADRVGIIVVDSLELVSDPNSMRYPLLTMRHSVQERFRIIFPKESALAEAMLLARKEGIDFDQRDRFARAGLAHLLAISGLHVGLIAGTLLLLGGVLRLSPRVTVAGTIVTTIGYILFLGAPHAATRAALQITLVLVGRLLQRPADPFSLIGTAALLLLIHDPLALIDPGFQLSFAGTGGIIALRRRILPLFPRQVPGLVSESLTVSLAATIATAPITVIHFGQIAPVGVIANLAAIPVTGAAVPAMAIALILSYLSLGLGTFIAGAAELLLGLLGMIATSAANLPGAQLLIPRDAVLGWAIAVLLAAIGSGWIAGQGRRVRPVVRQFSAIGIVTASMIVWPLAIGHLHDGRLEIHAIDVGQGDAFAIRTPGGRWILVDVGEGGGRGYDAGRTRVVPFLLRQGVRRVDAMILTHPDSDHIGGAGAVLDAFEVGLVIDPGVAVGKVVYSELLHRAMQGRLRWIAARGDLELTIDDIVIQLLEPETELDETPTTNHFSVAFRLEYGDFAALFLGDAPAELEEGIAARYGDALRSDLLKVAHHGSRTSTAEAILDVAEPRIAMISVGRRNRYGHPAPEVLARLEAREIEILRTDHAGNITLRTGPDGRFDLITQR